MLLTMLMQGTVQSVSSALYVARGHTRNIKNTQACQDVKATAALAQGIMTAYCGPLM